MQPPDEFEPPHDVSEPPEDESDPISVASEKAKRHVWDQVKPSECNECRDNPRQFLEQVYALAIMLLGRYGDDHTTLGNPADGYTLMGAIHAAVQVMHQQALPYFDAAGNAGPDGDAPLGSAAADYLDIILDQRADGRGIAGDGWSWWTNKLRTFEEAHRTLFEAFLSVPSSPSRRKHGQVFLLGAGFSRAASDAMPTMAALLQSLQQTAGGERWELVGRFGLSRSDNLEAWLDSLAAPMPYRSEAENTEAAALFLRVAEWLARHLAATEAQAFQIGYPGRLVDLLRHWQANRSTVITLNYDTIIERCVEARSDGIGVAGGALAANGIRAVPLSPTSAYRGAARLGGGSRPDGFRLAKLHGSIDWQYPGGGGRGLPIFAVDTDQDDEAQRGLAQMVPYIIPPCFTKMPLFDHEIIRQNWYVARQGLQRAEELVVMGYSLPTADTAVVQMLRAHAPDRIVLLDTNTKLKEHYEMLLGAAVEMPSSGNPIWEWVNAVASQP